MAGVFHPLGVALAAGTGAAIGELSGYLVGFSGQAVVEKSEKYDMLTRWMQRYGPITVYFLAAIPNPLFDIAGVIAGTLKFRLSAFLFFCWLGEVTKMLVFAYLGSRIFGFFEG
jgi:membrane protein YqaA with SNARE-associated domain